MCVPAYVPVFLLLHAIIHIQVFLSEALIQTRAIKVNYKWKKKKVLLH